MVAISTSCTLISFIRIAPGRSFPRFVFSLRSGGAGEKGALLYYILLIVVQGAKLNWLCKSVIMGDIGIKIVFLKKIIFCALFC